MLSDGGPTDTADDVTHRYVESLGGGSWLDKIPVRVMRFAVTTGWSCIEPITGAIATTVDNFLLRAWFPNKTPRLFLKEAGLLAMETPRVRAPIQKGRSRNKACPCGSTIKYKHCCGASL